MYIIANGGIYKDNYTNTMEAILLTKNASFIDGVLIDVRLTLDNKLVTCKYDDLSKNTLSKGMVSKTNYHDLKKIRLPNKIFKYYIPLLEDVLNKYKSKKMIILNLHDALGKNDILVHETIKLVEKYPNYNFFLETSSNDILERLINKDSHYKIGVKFTSYPIDCDGRTSFCDTLHNTTNQNINTYNMVFVHAVNNQNDLKKFLKYLNKDKINDLIIISDNPKRVKYYLNENNSFFR